MHARKTADGRMLFRALGLFWLQSWKPKGPFTLGTRTEFNALECALVAFTLNPVLSDAHRVNPPPEVNWNRIEPDSGVPVLEVTDPRPKKRVGGWVMAIFEKSPSI